MNNGEHLPELPKGWVWAALGEIALKLKAGGTPSTKVNEYYENGTIPFVKIEDMTHSNKYLYDTMIKITEKGLNNCSAWLVPENSLLYSMYASYGLPIINKIKLATNQAIIVFISPGNLIYLDYVYYYLLKIKPTLGIYIREKTGKNVRGTTQINLNADIVRKIPILLSPLPEQHRIVAKIEELFTQLDAGVEALKKTKAQLKRYRQAVLKYAFEGKLTEEWREAHKSELEPASMLLERIKKERKKFECQKKNRKKKELPPLDTSELPKLPEGWVWVRLEEISEINPKLPLEKISDDLEVSFLPMKAVEEKTGKFDLSYVKRYRDVKKGYTSFINGDIIFAKITPCMENGKIAIVNGLKNGIGFGSTEFHVISLVKENMPKKYFFFYLNREGFRRDGKRNMTGTVGHMRVPTKYIRQESIPLPPLPEQHRIVEEIERRFSVIDEISKGVEENLTRAEKLRQSILKKAFEGKLVPQDPTDESASVLLERIREGKRKQEEERKSRKNIKKKREKYMQKRLI